MISFPPSGLKGATGPAEPKTLMVALDEPVIADVDEVWVALSGCVSVVVEKGSDPMLWVCDSVRRKGDELDDAIKSPDSGIDERAGLEVTEGVPWKVAARPFRRLILFCKISPQEVLVSGVSALQ